VIGGSRCLGVAGEVVLAKFEGAGVIAGVEEVGACDVAFAVLEGEAEGEFLVE
jgi:hypothetical protein